MSQSLALVLTASLAALVGVLVYWMVTYRHAAAKTLSLVPLIGVAVAVVVWLAPGQIGTRGSIDETAAVALCYVSMLLGMMAEYWYAQAEKGAATFKFEWTTFMMPIFASPIVFIPLLTIAADAVVGGAFTRAKLMIYLVAFQNGFFWKSFFEQRRKELGAAAQPTARPEPAHAGSVSA